VGGVVGRAYYMFFHLAMVHYQVCVYGGGGRGQGTKMVCIEDFDGVTSDIPCRLQYVAMCCSV